MTQIKNMLLLAVVAVACCLQSGCATTAHDVKEVSGYSARISVADQSMRLYKDGLPVKDYPVSTSKYGLGDQMNSYRTPLGKMAVAEKIGNGVPYGGKFYRRKFTREVFDLANYDPVKHPADHDSILTRIIWLRGMERQNRNAYERAIYIHGTNQEHMVGQWLPSSYGCIRMKNRDVLEFFNLVTIGVVVEIQKTPLSPLHETPKSSGTMASSR